MTDEVQSQQEETTTSTESQTVETTTTEQTLIQTEAAKPEIPAKFLKDGTPDYDALTKAYTELEKKIGSKVPVADIAEYDFQFQTADEWDVEQLEAFKGQAKEWGLSKDQFNNAMALYEQNITAVLDQYVPNVERAQVVLQDHWGNDYGSNMKSAAHAIETFYPDALNDHELSSNPKFIKVMAEIGKQLKEDNAPSTVNTGTGARLSKLEVEALIARPDYRTNKEVQHIVTAWYESKKS